MLSFALLIAGFLAHVHAGAELYALDFVPYYSYTGSLAVSGSVGPFTTIDGTQTIPYDLADVDPLCANGAGTAGNSCGVHIHSGATCEDNAGGHFYTTATDGWATVAYTSSGGSTSGTIVINTGTTAADITGKAFIVHGYDGGRIACAIIASANQVELFSSGFVPYYTYAGALDVSGDIGPISSKDGTQTIPYELTGVDPLCANGAGTAGNSCGVHIHSGATCEDDALGHFYATQTDGWATVAYTSDSSGKTSGSIVIETGLTLAQITGKAFIVHGYDGGRIACSILASDAESLFSS